MKSASSSTLDVLSRVKATTYPNQVIAVNTFGIPMLWVDNPQRKIVKVLGKDRKGEVVVFYRFRKDW